MSLSSADRSVTYYGRSQLKPAPFDPWMVGAYIFLAGLSGSSSLIAATGDLVAPGTARGLSRRGRYLALLAPTLGSVLLILDLHTPKRFYNMLRVAKARSPMSIGTWLLAAFTAGAFPAALGEALEGRSPRLAWAGSLRRVGQVPAAAAGAGLSVYTAALLSATSTPLWAAAPKALGVRFAASSVSSAAAALALGEDDPSMRGRLNLLTLVALAVEAGALACERRALDRTGVKTAERSAWGLVDLVLVRGLGLIAPVALLAAAVGASVSGRRSDRTAAALSTAASLGVLAGSFFLRAARLGLGGESARRPEISLSFAQPEHLPEAYAGPRGRTQGL